MDQFIDGGWKRRNGRRQQQRQKPITKLRGQHFAQLISDCSLNIQQTPPPNYTIDRLATLRDRLNVTKSSMDRYYVGAKTDKDLAARWGRLNSIVDLYRPLKRRIVANYGAQLVTNAFLKYYEMYDKYELTKPADSGAADEPFMAFFNAELPGAAVCAYNHYMATAPQPRPFDWRASSLAPDGANEHNTSVLGDAYGLFAANRDKWLMQLGGRMPPSTPLAKSSDNPTATDGETSPATNQAQESVAEELRSNDEQRESELRRSARNNGDVTIIANLLDFEAKLGPASAIGGVSLYSSDAGIDVSETEDGQLNFNNQELANARIHLGCAISGLLTLRLGGNMILKQYTFFESFTWNLILIYATMFEDFHICKPLTSRPYNSEVYLIGRGFKGMPADIRKVLLDRLADFSTAPFIAADEVPTAAYSQIREIASRIFGQQIDFIRENMELMERWGGSMPQLNTLSSAVYPVQQDVCNEWLAKYPVRAITKDKWLKFIPRPNHDHSPIHWQRSK